MTYEEFVKMRNYWTEVRNNARKTGDTEGEEYAQIMLNNLLKEYNK